LKELEGQQGLTPFQQFSRLSSIPGITPQMIQSGAELLRQQGMLGSLNKGGGQGERKPDFSDIRNEPLPPNAQQKPKSVTTPKGVKATVDQYIPMSTQEKQKLADDLHKQNPGLYPDFNSAIGAAEQIDKENQSRNIAEQNQRKGQQDVQSTVLKELEDRSNTLGKNLGVNLPGNVFADLQDKAIAEINKGEKSEKEIAADYGKEIDKIMRQYADVKAVGDLGIIGKPRQAAATFKRLQKEFAERDDTKNLAEQMQVYNGISPMLSYSLAQPISEHPEIVKNLKSIPKLKAVETIAETVYPDSIEKTKEIAPKLASLLKNSDASPLAIAQELKKKGYDPTTFLDYLSENKGVDKLDLRPSQVDQLTKETDYLIGPLNDIWLSQWTGLGE